MKKNITLSLVAGAILASSALFVGCGSSSTTATTTGATTTAPVVNSYLVYLPTAARDDANQPSLKDTNNTSGTAVIYDNNKTTGKIRFPNTITGNILVPANARIDSNGNGVYDNNGTDKIIGFVMKGKANQPITPLSTYEIENNTTLPASLQGVDPIAAMKAGDPTAYLIEQAIIKAINVNAGSTAKNVLQDLNITVAGITSNSNDANITNALQIANKANIEALKVSLNGGHTNVEKIITSTELDNNLTRTIQAVVKDNNLTAEVATNLGKTEAEYNADVTQLEEAETNTSNAIDAQPAKLSIGSISIGGITAHPAENGSFSAIVNTTDKNITDFYNITLNTSATKGFPDVNNTSLTITITDKTLIANSVSLKIEGVRLSAAENGNITTTIPVSSKITVTQNNLGKLESIMTTGTPYIATTTKELVTTDLSFSINTLLANLSNSNVQDALNALNSYLSQAREYTVSLDLNIPSNKLVSDITTFTGSVTVENTTTTSVTSSSSSSTGATDPFGNPITGSSSSTTTSSSSSTTPTSSSSSTGATDPFGNPIN